MGKGIVFNETASLVLLLPSEEGNINDSEKLFLWLEILIKSYEELKWIKQFVKLTRVLLSVVLYGLPVMKKKFKNFILDVKYC